MKQRFTPSKSLIKAFTSYQARYTNADKKPDLSKLLPNMVYSEMRLEGEKVSRKEIEALFKK